MVSGIDLYRIVIGAAENRVSKQRRTRQEPSSCVHGLHHFDWPITKHIRIHQPDSWSACLFPVVSGLIQLINFEIGKKQALRFLIQNVHMLPSLTPEEAKEAILASAMCRRHTVWDCTQ